MNKHTFLIAPLMCALALWACSSDDDDTTTTQPTSSEQSGNDTGDESGDTDGGTSSSTTTDTDTSLDFEVSWEVFPESGYTDATDSPSSTDDADDFVENSSFTSTINIAYDGTTATVAGEVDGVEVTVDGAYVTVNSSAKAVEYVLTGATTDGSFKVYSEKKFKLTLAGADITSTQGAAINIQSKKRVFLNLEAGTQNALTDAASYGNTPDDEDQKACLFSEGQLIVSGNGSLTINANYKHAICSDDYLFMHAGPHITVASAPKDAIHTNEKVVVAGGYLTITSTGDAIECEEGSIDIRSGLLKLEATGTASKVLKSAAHISITGGQVVLLASGDAEYDSDENDISSAACLKCDSNVVISDAQIAMKATGLAGKGVNTDGTFTMKSGTLKVLTTGSQYVVSDDVDSSPKAIKAQGDLTISGGTVLVRTTGGDGGEGIESKATMTISGGTVAVSTYDDCLNAKTHIQISGGDIYCLSSGNDAIDSNGTLSIAGGTIVAIGTTVPESGIDCDENTFAITGGTLIAVGGTTSTPTANASTQSSLIYNSRLSQGTLLTLLNSSSGHIFSYAIPTSYNETTILYSSADLAQGDSYTLYTAGTVAGGDNFHGLVTDADYTPGTTLTTFTQSSTVTNLGGSQGNWPGGQPGGFGR